MNIPITPETPVDQITVQALAGCIVDVLDREGWTKGYTTDHIGQHCLAGAAYCILYGHTERGRETEVQLADPFNHAKTMLGDAFDRAIQNKLREAYPYRSFHGAVGFNDSHETTIVHVKEMLRAIESDTPYDPSNLA